jgi:sugar/nucleoside kinase (ribokinase family)
VRKHDFDCLVIGDVMFDVFVEQLEVTNTFLRNGTSYCDYAKIEFGGAGNVAAGLSLLGTKVSFIGKTGNDTWGRLYSTELTNRKIITAISFEKRIRTGLSLVSVTRDGERSFYVFRGANNSLSTKDIDKSIDLLKNSEYFYFSGYSLVAEPQRSAILHAIKLSKRYGVKLFLDPGAYNIIQNDLELFNKLLDTCDFFCPNIDEAKAITKSMSLEEAISKLQKRCKLIGIKLGREGCILVSDNTKVKVPGFPANCVDTTGAGDAFAAALIYGLVKHLPLKSAGRLANWFAAKVTNGIGARTFALESEVMNFRKSLECGKQE